MKKVLVKENPTGVMVAGAFFTIVFIITSLSILSLASSFVSSWFLLPFILVPLLILGAIFGMGVRVLGGGKKASSLFNEASLTETSVAFPEEVEYELGRVFLEGYWTYGHTTTSSGTTTSRRYRTRRSFRAEERGRGLEAPLPEGPFRVELRPDGTGIIEAPALRIRGGRYDGSLILVLTDKGVVEGEGQLSLSRGDDMAQVSFRGDGKFLRGNVWAELSKARKVRIEVGSGDIWKKVAEGGSFDFSFSTLPEEKTVLFTHYGSVTPRSILGKLWSGPVIMGHGTFELKAVLDIPLGRDVVETDVFKVEVEFEERKIGEEKETTAGGWGLAP
ncbi:hypothetical protein [Thermococcus gorgonarius]|uniref:Uncharacterized protein n=1 Tax=Thermococcus gorgonarius TaxID=71997 RepID=A0A2Z2M878_THEGO|nr:hypothetical protein [Thermococcus gorgonarius]ASJ01543.1 hypothetical protein A3K92_08650 [Thermococcus gorgonarius]